MNARSTTLRGRSRKSAQSLVEVTVASVVLVLLMFVPFVDLITYSLRYNFLSMASRDAAYFASRSKTFLNNVSSTDLSAVNEATAAAQLTAAAFPVTVNSVVTNIVITKLSTGQVTRQSTPLNAPADTTDYAYQIEVVLSGSTNPILQVPAAGLWSDGIPGLTAAVSVSIASRAFFENPQGLNQ